MNKIMYMENRVIIAEWKEEDGSQSWDVVYIDNKNELTLEKETQIKNKTRKLWSKESPKTHDWCLMLKTITDKKYKELLNE